MTSSANSGERSLLQDVLYTARYYLGGRIGLIVIAAAALAAGAYFNWGWLVAAGLAPIILALAPCAVMCAMGLCMRGQQKDSGSGQPINPPGGGQSLPLASSQNAGAGSIDSAVGRKTSANGNHKGCC